MQTTDVKCRSMILGDCVKRYLNSCGLSTLTREAYRGRLLHFAKKVAPEYVHNLTTEHIERYIASLSKSDLKPQSVNGYIAAIQSFCKWLKRTYHLADPSLEIFYLKQLPREIRILKETEYQQLLKTNKGVDRDVVQFLACTGLRTCEFIKLQPTDVVEDMLHIRYGKGGKERYVPLNEMCKAIIAKYSNPSTNTINLRKSNKLYGNWLKRLCHRTARKANIEPFSPHCLRHLFAMRLYRAKIDILKISRILGHTSIKITQDYLHINEHDLDGITDCLKF